MERGDHELFSRTDLIPSYGVALAQETVSSLGWKDKLGLLFHNKDMDSQRLHCVALAILWNQCLRTMAYMIFKSWSETKEKDEATQEKEHGIIHYFGE